MTDGKVINLGLSAKRRKNKLSNKNSVTCSFCNRAEDEVLKMVQGPKANICSECLMIALQYLILKESIPNNEAQAILDAFWKKDNK